MATTRCRATTGCLGGHTLAKKFVLTITLGNDAMQNEWDVHEALEDVGLAVHYSDKGTIMDGNGNAVGHWDFK